MEIISNYDKKFKNVSEETLKGFTLRANLMLVERIDLETKTKSGLVLTTSSKKVFDGVAANTLEYHLVVKVGEGYEDEEGKLDPELLECREGNIVVLPTGGINYLSYFGPAVDSDSTDKIGLARTSDCFMIFEDEKAFKKFFEELK